jgi:hypothetical protein
MFCIIRLDGNQSSVHVVVQFISRGGLATSVTYGQPYAGVY